MKAIFDKNCDLVGWYDNKNNMIFDTEMRWVGFVVSGYIFYRTSTWLGGYYEGSINDKQGKPVAWVDGNQPRGTLPLMRPLRPLRPLTPLRPLRPLRPLHPLRPLTPLGGWSRLSWKEFLDCD